MELIVEFLLKYWVEFLCIIVSTGLTTLFFKLKKTYKKGKDTETNEQKQEFLKAVQTVIKEETSKLSAKYAKETKKLQDEIAYIRANLEDQQEEFTILKNGVLSTQGRHFRHECRCLLAEEHHITLQEFENLQKEHHIYNSLGGNSDGDDLFNLVKRKFEGEISTPDE